MIIVRNGYVGMHEKGAKSQSLLMDLTIIWSIERKGTDCGLQLEVWEMGLLLFLLVARPNIKAPFRTCMNFMLYLTWSNQSALIRDWMFLGIQRCLRQLPVILLLLRLRLILAFVVLPKRDLVLSLARLGGTLGRNCFVGLSPRKVLFTPLSIKIFHIIPVILWMLRISCVI